MTTSYYEPPYGAPPADLSSHAVVPPTDPHPEEPLPDFTPEQPPSYQQSRTTSTTASIRHLGRRTSSLLRPCFWKDFRFRLLNDFDPRLWSWIWIAQVDPRHVDRILTPAHWAAAAGDVENVEAFLGDRDGKRHLKAPTSIFKGDVQLCLHLAAAFGRTEVAKLLLERGWAEVDYEDARDQTALYVAVKQNETEVAVMLLEAGWSSIKFPPRHPTALDLAITNDNSGIVESLLTHKASVSFFNTHGNYPLHIAARSASPTIISLLLSHNARMDLLSTGLQLSPLHIAASNYNASAIYTLLLNGADVNIAGGHDRKTPLHVAVGQHVDDELFARRKVETIRALIDNGADVNAVDKFDRSILHYAVSIRPLAPSLSPTPFVTNVIPSIVDLLLEHHAEINACATAVSGGFVPIRRTAWTPLHEASFSGEPSVIRTLLARGIKASIRDGEGRTPLDAAIDRYFQRVPKETKEQKAWRERQAIEAVQTLIDCGADATMCRGWKKGARDDPGDARVVVRIVGEERRLANRQGGRFRIGGSSGASSSKVVRSEELSEGLPKYTEA